MAEEAAEEAAEEEAEERALAPDTSALIRVSVNEDRALTHGLVRMAGRIRGDCTSASAGYIRKCGVSVRASPSSCDGEISAEHPVE